MTKEQAYRLSDEGISAEGKVWKYSDIRQVAMKFTPTRYYSGIYQCEVSSSTGTFIISNRRYKSPANFDYQNEAYSDFILELHRKLSDTQGVRYTSGKPKAKFIAELIAALIFFPLLVYMLFALGQLIVAGLMALIIVARLVPYYQKNKPQEYQPFKVPDALLPKK